MKVTIDLNSQDQANVKNLSASLQLNEEELLLRLIRAGLDQQLGDTAYQAYFHDLKRSIRKNAPKG